MPGKKKARQDIDFTLRRVFGKQSFRLVHVKRFSLCNALILPSSPLQREVITAALDGEDVFLQAATSFGKSLCFQLPAIVDYGSTFSSEKVNLETEGFVCSHHSHISSSGIDGKMIIFLL